MRTSFSAFNLNTALVDFYNKEDFYSSIIPASAGFQGFKRENGVQPRIKLIVNNIGFTQTIVRQDSNRVLRISDDVVRSVSKITNLPNEATPTVDPQHLFDNVGKGPTNIVVIGDNSLDNRKLTEYMTYNWPKWSSDRKLSWGKFDYVIRADLRTLTAKPQLSSLAQFLTDSLKSQGIDVLEADIITILRNQAVKVLVILEWHLRPEQLADLDQYPNLRAILNSLRACNLIVTAKAYARKYVEMIFKPNIILENIGYIPRDIEKYLENNFQDQPFYQSLLSLFSSNKELQEICKSPSILEMVCYIMVQGDQFKLQSSIRSPTMSGLYSDMMRLNGLRYADKYIRGSSKADVFGYPIVRFMQELAYEALTTNSKLISETLLLRVLEPYINDILKGLDQNLDPIDLIKEFGIIQPAPNSLVTPQYFFTDFSFQEFLAASHLERLLTSSEEKDIKAAKFFISVHGNNKEYLQTMKFLFGLISRHEDERSKLIAMETLGNALVYSSENILKIGGDNQIIYMMHLLSQAVKNGELDPFIPQRVIDYLDNIILKDLEKWGPHLIKSQYLSTTIITELLNMLSGNKQEFLQACEILALLNGISLDKKTEIAGVLMSKFLDHDLEIVEVSIRSLQHMLDIPAVSGFLIRALTDPRISVKLVAIEVQGQIANHNSVAPMLARLSDEDSWVVVATLDSLKNLYHLRDLREAIALALIERLGEDYGIDQIILPKLFECLKHFRYEEVQIYGILQETINKDSDLNRVVKAVTAMKNLANLPSIDANTLTDDMLTKYNGLKSIISNSKYYPLRANIINLFSILFPRADANHRNKIILLLEHDIASKGELVQVSIVNILSEILHIDANRQDKVFSLCHMAMSSKFVNVRVLAINIMSTLSYTYLVGKDSEIITIMANLLAKNMASLNKELLIIAIQALGRLGNNERYASAVLANIKIFYATYSAYEDIQIAALEAISEIFAKLPRVTRDQELSCLSEQAESHPAEKVRIAAIKAIDKNSADVATSQSAVVKENVRQLTMDARSDSVKDAAIDIFIRLYDNQETVNQLLDLHLNAANNPSEKAAAIYSMGRLVAKTSQTVEVQTLNRIITIFFSNIDLVESIPSLMAMIGKVSADRIEEISNHLFTATSNPNPIIKGMAINALVHLATAPITIRDQVKPLFGQYTRDKLSVAENVESVKYLANKYSSGDLIVSSQDQPVLNELFYSILLRCLQTTNVFIHMRLINLLTKVKYDEAAVLDILNYELGLHRAMQDKLKIINVMKTLFSTNNRLMSRLSQISTELSPKPVDLDSKFPNIAAIMANLDEFAHAVIDNHLDVRITIDRLILPEREYSFAHLNDIELQLDYAKKLYLAIIELNNESLLENQVEHLFYEITRTYLDNENIQLTVLHETTDKHSLTDIKLVSERKTVFGDILVKSIFISDHRLKLNMHRSIEENYPQLTLGKPSEYIEYHVSSFSITSAEEEALIKSLESCKNKEQLFAVLSKTFATHLENYRWQTDGISMSHNKVIKTSGYEDRLVKVERKLKDVEQQLIDAIKDFQGFKVSQKTINDVIKSLQEKEQIEVLPDLDDYHRGLAIRLAHGLNELHMAAMVVQTEMVSNNQKGVVGNIGAFFNTISVHIPMVGATVDIFGSMLSAVDANIQAAIAKNIADLAISPSDMAQIAKKLSIKIATSTIKIQELNKQDMLAMLNNILNFAIDVKTSILNSIAGVISSKFEHQSELSSEETRGEQDAELILQILVGYIAAGNCRLSINWQVNYNILDRFFSKNYIIEGPVQAVVIQDAPLSQELIIDTTLIPIDQNIARSTDSSEQGRKTPVRIKKLYEKATAIADEVFSKTKLLLGVKADVIINQEQQEAFIGSLASALTRENYDDNQRLLYFYDQSSLLKSNLIGQLASQFVYLKAFKINGAVLTINAKFMIDGPVFTDAMDHTRSVLQHHRYYNRLEKPIFIEYTAKPDESWYSNFAANFANIETKVNIDQALSGGILIKSLETLPALEYLLTDYIPIIPLIKDIPIFKSIGQYKYPVTVGLYALGSLAFARGLAIHPVYALISTAFFAAREPIYQFRAETLNHINASITDGWVKFGVYVATDTGITLAMAAPLTPVTPIIAAGGVAFGAINYYSSKYHEDNIVASMIARSATTIAIYPCKKFVEMHPTHKEQVLATGTCIGILANIQYFSKVAGIMTVELSHDLLVGEAKNSTTEGEMG